MRLQSKSAVSYVMRNFSNLFVIAILPCMCMGFFADAVNVPHFVSLFVNGELTTENFVSNLVADISFLRFGRDFWMLFVAFALFALGACYLGVRVGRHMRTGLIDYVEPRFVLPFYPQMCLYLAMFLGGYEAMQLIVVGVGALVADSGILWLSFAVVMALEVLAEGAICYLFAISVCSFPAGYVEGYRLSGSLAYSIRLVASNKKFVIRFVGEYLLTRLVVGFVAFAVQGISSVGRYTVAHLAYTLMYLWLFIYAVAIAFCYYYSLTDTERRDLSQIIVG